jgi:diacylglycerol kinase family enzyme
MPQMNPAPSKDPRRFIVIVNRAAGELRQMQPAAIEEEMSRAFEAAGANAELILTEPGDLEQMLDRSIAARPDVLIVAGGDGTVGSAARRCAEAGIPLGIIPLGTFNLLARDLGVPLERAAAIKALATAPVRPMDMLKINEHVCLCMTVLGFYPVLARTQKAYHGWWPVRLLRNLRAAWRMAVAYPRLNIQVSAPSASEVCLTRFALFANNGYEEMFGLFRSGAASPPASSRSMSRGTAPAAA